MHILVTNDDGVQAPGLLALAQALEPLGQVTVFAPNQNWSASGHVKTMHRPLRAYPTRLADGTEAMTTDGAPSDCVALALLGLLPDPVDLVVSGINPSANVGHDVTYSGTVTAAMEAAIAGVPALAVSLDVPEAAPDAVNFDQAARVARRLAEQSLGHGLPEGVFLNINVPYGESSHGMAITRQGLRVYRDELVERDDPRGNPYYWIGGEPPSGRLDPGTDLWALAQGLVSVTPLQLDLTASDALPHFEGWELGI